MLRKSFCLCCVDASFAPGAAEERPCGCSAPPPASSRAAPLPQPPLCSGSGEGGHGVLLQVSPEKRSERSLTLHKLLPPLGGIFRAEEEDDEEGSCRSVSPSQLSVCCRLLRGRLHFKFVKWKNELQPIKKVYVKRQMGLMHKAG